MAEDMAASLQALLLANPQLLLDVIARNPVATSSAIVYSEDDSPVVNYVAWTASITALSAAKRVRAFERFLLTVPQNVGKDLLSLRDYHHELASAYNQSCADACIAEPSLEHQHASCSHTNLTILTWVAAWKAVNKAGKNRERGRGRRGRDRDKRRDKDRDRDRDRRGAEETPPPRNPRTPAKPPELDEDPHRPSRRAQQTSSLDKIGHKDK